MNTKYEYTVVPVDSFQNVSKLRSSQNENFSNICEHLLFLECSFYNELKFHLARSLSVSKDVKLIKDLIYTSQLVYLCLH